MIFCMGDGVGSGPDTFGLGRGWNTKKPGVNLYILYSKRIYSESPISNIKTT